jgi:hypothetical protein
MKSKMKMNEILAKKAQFMEVSLCKIRAKE